MLAKYGFFLRSPNFTVHLQCNSCTPYNSAGLTKHTLPGLLSTCVPKSSGLVEARCPTTMAPHQKIKASTWLEDQTKNWRRLSFDWLKRTKTAAIPSKNNRQENEMAAALPITSAGKPKKQHAALLGICHATYRASCKWKTPDNLPLQTRPAFLEASVTTMKHDMLPPSTDVSL